MSIEPTRCHRFRLDRILLWFGIAASLLCILGLWMSWNSNRHIWLSTHTMASAGFGSLDLALVEPGSVGVNSDGEPTHMIGRGPIWRALIPFWFLLLVFALMILLAWRWPHRRRTGQCPACGFVRDCPACGYSVASLPRSIVLCPECGAALTAASHPHQRAGDSAPSPSSAPAAAKLKGHISRWRFSRFVFWSAALASVALTGVMYWCRATPQLGWLATHSYCILYPDVVVFTIIDGPPPSGRLLDARGIPGGTWKTPIWRTRFSIWLLPAFTLALTITAWCWGRRRWQGPCPNCNKPRPSP